MESERDPLLLLLLLDVVLSFSVLAAVAVSTAFLVFLAALGLVCFRGLPVLAVASPAPTDALAMSAMTGTTLEAPLLALGLLVLGFSGAAVAVAPSDPAASVSVLVAAFTVSKDALPTLAAGSF